MVTSVASMIKQFNIPNIRLLQEQGYEVTVVTNFINPGTIPVEDSKKLVSQLKSIGVNPINVNIQRSPLDKKNIEAYQDIKKIISSGNFDLIHCQSPIGGALTRIAARKKRKKGVKVVYTAHGFHFFKNGPIKYWLTFYPIEKYLSNYTDILITINKEDYQIAKRKFGAQKVVYIPGVGVDTEKFKNVNVDKTEKRRELNIPKEAFLILSIGELSARKNHEVAIRAIATLNNPNIYYVICGQGELEHELKKLSIDLKISDKVQFLGYRNDIYEICKVSDLFIFPSTQEGLPVALMEAMASELPIVCSNIRGNNDLVIDGKGGFLVSQNNIKKYARSIEKIVDNESTMGKYNGKVIKNYTKDVVTKEMQSIYSL